MSDSEEEKLTGKMSDSEEETSVYPTISDNPTGQFLIVDTSSTEDEKENKRTVPEISDNSSGQFLIDDTSSTEEEEEDKETDLQKDNQGNVSSDDSEKFEDAHQHQEASPEPPMKLTLPEKNTSQNSEDSGSPSSPEAVWNPPTFSSAPPTTNQAPHSGDQEIPVHISPSVPPKSKETTPSGELANDRTVYQNWDPDDKAQGDRSNEPRKPEKKEEAPKNRTVYQNWNLETESAPPQVPERTYRGNAPPPIPPKSFRSMAPTPESAVYGSDEYHSMRSTTGITHPSNTSTQPTLPVQSSTMQHSNTSLEEQAPALPPKPPISDFESLPPKMEYPHIPNPSNPYTSMPGGMPSYGNPYLPGKQFHDFDPSVWGITQEKLQDPSYMQQFMYWQYYNYMQQQQQYPKGAAPPKNPSGPTSGGDSINATPGQDKKIPDPKAQGHTTPSIESRTKPATEHKPPKHEPKKKERKPKKPPPGNVETEPKPAPKQPEQTSEDLFVCVSGLHPNTTEDTLSNFLEARATEDVEVESVVYNDGKNTAIVQFDSPVDAVRLNDASKRKTLEGKCIEISAVDPVKLIVVSAEGEVTDAELKEYFQNKTRSGGGEVQRVTSRNDGCFTVKFKQEEDALRVCKKQEHKVSNTPVVVTPMFFTEQGEIYDSSKHTVPIPEAFTIKDVDSHKQRFLQQSNPVLEQLNSELVKKHAKVVIAQEEIQVECLLNQKTPNVRQLIKSWTTDVKESFDDYLRESIHKTEIEVTEDAWKEVEEYITITHTHSPDSILTVYERDSLKIVFVGEHMLVQEVHIQTSNQHKAIESKIERKKQIKSEERECCASNIRLLERLGVFAEVNSIREDLDVDADFSNGKILFRGVREDILEARVKIEEKLSQFERWTISEELSKYQILMLGTEPGQSSLQKEFESKGLTVEMEFQDDCIKVYTIDSSQKSMAHKIILDLTKESVIALDETSLNVLSTEKWEYEMMKIQSEFYERVMISPANDAKITVTATSELHDDVRRKLEDFIKENSIYTDIVDIEDEGVMKFIGKHCSKQLDDIQDNLKQHFVKLNVQNKQVMIEGTKEGLSQAKSDIMDMIRDIHHVMKTYDQPGINKVLRTDQEQLMEIEDRCRSVIMFTGPKQSDTTFRAEPVRSKRRIIPEREEFQSMPMPGSRLLYEEERMLQSAIFPERPRPVPALRIQTGPYCCAESNIMIRLIRGDLAKQEGDVIVCSVAQDLQLKKGKSSRNLLEVGGPGLMAEVETNYPNGIQAGELAIISGGNLRCQKLYLGYLPNWGSTKGKILVEFMKKCLKTAHDSSYQSIVFAALGTGQLGYPKDEVAEMMYQTVIDFDRKCAGTQVKEVKFICYHGDLETCEAFEAEEKHRLNPHLPKTKVKASKKGPYITKNKMKVSIVKAEIGKHSADVLVVACEKSLNLTSSGKAAQSLLQSGGGLLQEGAKVKYPNGIANFGDFASIPGAGLNCQEVYLTAIPGEEQKSQATLRKFVTDCMKHADQSGYSSIAFAAMGTGSMKYSATDVAKNFYHEVKKYSNNHPSCNVKHVQFVLHPADTKTIKAFEDHEMQLLNKTVYSSGSSAYTTPSHGIVVTVKTASITKLKDDVIVVSAYPDLDLSRTQVTQAVVKEGGVKIQMDIKSSYPNGIKEGDLAIVTAGNLPCKEVYIMTLPKYTEDPKLAEKILKDSVMKCLTVGTQKGHNSVSFPCLGTGYNGYPHIQAAALLFEAVTEYDSKVSTTSVKNVNFVALSNDRKSLGAFQSEEKKFCSQQAQPSLAQSILGQSVSFGSLGSSVAAGATSLARGMMTRASRIFKSGIEEEEETSDVVAKPGQKQNEVVIGKMTVQVCAGDLTEQKVDAIVNSTNLELDFTQGGVSAALAKKCGKQLETECSAKKEEMKKKKIIVTSGCGLGNVKHIIHIECQDTIKKWRDMVKRTLEMADNTQCKSVAFPVLGTGKGFVTFKPESIGEMFVESFSDFLSQNGQCKITQVKIVAFQEEMVTPMSTAMRNTCGKPKNTGVLSKMSDLASEFGMAPKKGVASGIEEEQSVTLWIYADTQRNRDGTLEEIGKFIKSQSTETEMKDQLFTQLSQNEVKKINKLKEQLDIKLSLDQRNGKISLEGLTEEVASAKEHIHKLLRQFQKERWLDEEAKIIADTVQWSVMVQDQMTGIDKLEPYPVRENMYLEEAYKKKESLVTLTMEEGKVVVDLNTMKEYPANDPNSPDKLNVIRKEKITGNKIELPANWAPMKDNESIKVVTLLPSSPEYLDIEKRFVNSAKSGIYNIGKAPNPANNPVGQFNNIKVLKIERIQNPFLYQQYAAKKSHIEQHVQQGTTLEQDLWHGAPPTAIVSINYYGFNRSYCGNNAGEPWFGRGVYFANDASYSARDWVSQPDQSKKKKMYQAKVVTGHYCKGQKGMRYLPERMTGVNFDCAVDNESNPLEFVIFNDTQAYPEYCIEFTI